jgi:hypothetical protein
MKSDDVDVLSFCSGEGFLSAEEESLYLTPCIYCGMPASSVDHIPPRHMRAQLLELGDGLRGMIQRNLAVRDDIRKRLQWRGSHYGA